MHGACNTVRRCSTQLHFFDSYNHSIPEMNSNDYITRFMESYSIMIWVASYNIEEIKQQLTEVWQTINTFEKHDFCISVFPQVEQRH